MKPLKKKHLWATPRMRVDAGVLELWERRPAESIAFVVIALGPALAFSLLYGLTVGFDGFALIVVAILLPVCAALALTFYNAPRSLRLFPAERLAERSEHFFGLRYRVRWHDMTDSDFGFHPIKIQVESEEESWSGLTLGCLLMLIPGSILLYPVLRGIGSQKADIWVYAMHPVEPGLRPLIVLDDVPQVRRIVSAIEQLLAE